MTNPANRVTIISALSLPLVLSSGCAAVGSIMSPYPERFSCKNSDHGQCIHPERAYADAVAGRTPRSEPAVTNDRKLLAPHRAKAATGTIRADRASKAAMPPAAGTVSDRPYAGLAAAIDRPGTPMLKQSRTIRTLILPYADRQRPDRLYMARYVYSILDRPAWVVGDYMVEPVGKPRTPPVLRTARDRADDADGPPEPATPDVPLAAPVSLDAPGAAHVATTPTSPASAPAAEAVAQSPAPATDADTTSEPRP